MHTIRTGRSARRYCDARRSPRARTACSRARTWHRRRACGWGSRAGCPIPPPTGRTDGIPSIAPGASCDPFPQEIPDCPFPKASGRAARGYVFRQIFSQGGGTSFARGAEEADAACLRPSPALHRLSAVRTVSFMPTRYQKNILDVKAELSKLSCWFFSRHSTRGISTRAFLPYPAGIFR